MGHNTRNNDGGSSQDHDAHADQAADKAGDEANKHCVRSEREGHRHIKSRDCVLHELLGNALECRHDLAKHHTYTGENDEHASGEGGCLQHGEDKEVLAVTQVFFDVTGTGEQSHDHVDNSHGERDKNSGVTQEAETCRELDVFGGFGRVLLGTSQTCHKTAQCDTSAASVSQSYAISAGSVLHEWLHESRRNGNDQALCDGSPQQHTPSREAGNLENHSNHGRHIERHMAGQINVLEARSHRQQHIDDHTEEEDQRGFRTVLDEHGTNDGLIVRHHALHVKSVLEHIAEWDQCAGHNTSAGSQNQEADKSTNRTLHNVGALLVLHSQADQRNQRDDHRRLTEDIEQKRKNSVHDSLLIIFSIFLLFFVMNFR